MKGLIRLTFYVKLMDDWGNIESFDLTQKVNLLRLWREKNVVDGNFREQAIPRSEKMTAVSCRETNRYSKGFTNMIFFTFFLSLYINVQTFFSTLGKSLQTKWHVLIMLFTWIYCKREENDVKFLQCFYVL